MTCNVFAGTLNIAESINSSREVRFYTQNGCFAF